MKKKNRILTESQKRQIIKDKEKAILESFASTFNKIKRIEESELIKEEYGNRPLNNTEGGRPLTHKEIDGIIKSIQRLQNKYESKISHQGYMVYTDIDLNQDIAIKYKTPEGHDYWFHANKNNLYDVLVPKEATIIGTLGNMNYTDRYKENDQIDMKKGGNTQMNEDGSDTYFETLSAALDYVREQVKAMGYTLDEDDMWNSFGTGGITYGETGRGTINLLKDGKQILSKTGKPLNRAIQIVIYRMDSGRYELTWYKTW